MFERAKRIKRRIDESAIKAQSDLDKRKEQKENSAAIRCTNCFSTNVVFMENERKAFSVGKTVAGFALAGGVGTIAGFAGKKGKDIYHCNRCGCVSKISRHSR